MCSVEKFTKLFLCQTPLKDLCWDVFKQNLGIQEQKMFLHQTVLHPICKKYPISVEYQRKFLKRIINNLESRGEEICDELYEFYISILDVESPKYSYKSYFLPKKQEFIPFLESTNFLSSGTTGLTAWYGAMILAEWSIANSEIFTNKRILELGAGIGFSGTMLLKSCHVLSYCFTDYHSKVLSILNHNVKLNFGKVEKIDDALPVEELSLPAKYSADGTEISVGAIDWTDQCSVDALLQYCESFDIILAADVVFDPSLVRPLVETLFHILRRSCSPQNHCLAYFSLTVRNKDTFDLFCSELKLKSLNFVELSLDLPEIFHIDRNWDIRLLRIEMCADS